METKSGSPILLTDVHVEKAVKTYIEEVSDSIKSAFDKALKQRRKTQYPNAEIIIRALSSVGDNGAARADILKKVRINESKYPEANLKYMLPRLCTPEYGEIVRFDSNSGLYSFSEPMYRVYALARFKSGSLASVSRSSNQLEAFLIKALSEELNLGNGNSLRITIERPRGM